MAKERPSLSEADERCLNDAQVPVVSLSDACAGCPDNDASEYPRLFDVDLTSDMLGTCKEYGRQILVSTGKHDWIREVTDDKKSLAGLVYETYSSSASSNGKAADDKMTEKGLHASIVQKDGRTPSSRLSVVNSSFLSSAEQDGAQSVIVMPDYKVIREVPETQQGAQQLVNEYLSPQVGRAGASSASFKSWPLPYEAVVLLCSHKKRDQRCHIAAPLLYEELHHHLQQNDIETDNRGDGLLEGDAIEDWPADERDARLDASLKEAGSRQGSHRSVGIFSISHIGGHRYAGNVIICFPNGSVVWYGRVRPSDIAAIVKETIIGGRVIPELLRGGLGLANKCKAAGVISW